MRNLLWLLTFTLLLSLIASRTPSNNYRSLQTSTRNTTKGKSSAPKERLYTKTSNRLDTKTSHRDSYEEVSEAAKTPCLSGLEECTEFEVYMEEKSYKWVEYSRDAQVSTLVALIVILITISLLFLFCNRRLHQG